MDYKPTSENASAVTPPKANPITLPLKLNLRNSWVTIGNITLDDRINPTQWTFQRAGSPNVHGPWNFGFDTQGNFTTSIVPNLVIPAGLVGGNHGPYVSARGHYGNLQITNGFITRTGTAGGPPGNEDVGMEAGTGNETSASAASAT